MKNIWMLVLSALLIANSFAGDSPVGDVTKASVCSNHYSGRISEPRIKPPLNISVRSSSVVRFETIGSQEDTIEIITSGQITRGNQPISLNLGTNIVDFIVTGAGEKHAWHAVIKVDDVVVFEHAQDSLQRFSCDGEMYRYRLLFTVTADLHYVIATSVNLRDRPIGPRVNTTILGNLPIATQVATQPPSSYSEWVQVIVQTGEHEGQRGWLDREYLVDERPTIEFLRMKLEQSAESAHETRRMWTERILALKQQLTAPQYDRGSRMDRLSAKWKLTQESPVKIEWSNTYSLIGDKEPLSDERRLVPYHVTAVGNGFLIGRGLNTPFGAAYSLVKLDRSGKLEWEKTYEYREIHSFIPYKSGFVVYGQCFAGCVGMKPGRIAHNGSQPWIMYANDQGEPITNYYDWPLGGVFPLLASQGEVLNVYEKVSLCEGKVCYTETGAEPSSDKTSMKITNLGIEARTTNVFFTLPAYKPNFHSVNTFQLIPTAKGFLHVGAYVLSGELGSHTTGQSHFVAHSGRDGKLSWIKHLGALNTAIEINGDLFMIGASKGVRVVRLNGSGETISDKSFASGNRLIQITDAIRYANGIFVSGVRFDQKCEEADNCGARQNEEDVLMRFNSEGELLWEQTFPYGQRVVRKMLAVNDGIVLFSDSTLRATKMLTR